TGFRDVNDPPLPACDFKAFHGHCITAARLLGGRVRSFEAPGNQISTNFALAVLELPTAPVAVLLNAHFPLIAFAEQPARGEASLRFIDLPPLAEVFHGYAPYQVLTASELAKPVTPEECRQLAPGEQRQLRYWRPRRVGDVVFNF